MYQHKLVPEGTPRQSHPIYGKFYMDCDTIPCSSEWTAEQLTALASITREKWIFIHRKHKNVLSRNRLFISEYPFPQYLSDLLTLAPLKGLTVEEIKALNGGK